MLKLLPVFCLLLFFGFTPGAGAVVKKAPQTLKLSKKAIAPAHNPVPLRVDSSVVHIRSFNIGALSRYRNNPSFKYTRVITNTGQSWWERFWIWFWKLIDKLFGGTAGNASFSFMKYVFWAAIIGLFVFFIVKLFGLNISNIFSRRSKEVVKPYTESLENIHEITFDEEIEKAIAQRNYRLAIRLLYLSTLKQLNDLQLIHWQIEKTNSAYLNELTNSTQKQSFGKLTRQFEYVWYGDFPVNGQSFQNIRSSFHDFKQMLS
jgi:hypothetical protein